MNSDNYNNSNFMDKKEQPTWQRKYFAIIIALFMFVQNNIGRYIVACIEGDAPLRPYFYHWRFLWFRVLVIAVPVLLAIVHKVFLQKGDDMQKCDKAAYIIATAAVLCNICFMIFYS